MDQLSRFQVTQGTRYLTRDEEHRRMAREKQDVPSNTIITVNSHLLQSSIEIVLGDTSHQQAEITEFREFRDEGKTVQCFVENIGKIRMIQWT